MYHVIHQFHLPEKVQHGLVVLFGWCTTITLGVPVFYILCHLFSWLIYSFGWQVRSPREVFHTPDLEGEGLVVQETWSQA